MVKKCLVTVFLVLVGSIIVISDAYPEMTFDYGATIRLRQEIWDNVIDLKTLNVPDRNFFRFKTSFWGSVDFNKDIGAYLKLTSEVYYNLGPYKQPVGQRLDENELIVDNFYFKANNVFGIPVDLKIGRQDFLGPDMYGEGFLILDGNPNDGSRSFYFNAAKAKWRINEKNSIDFVYITNQQTDKYMPALRTAVPDAGTYYKHKKILNASDEQAFVVYGRNKLSENLTVEPYYIFKREEKFQFPFGSKSPLSVTPELDLNTIGARAVYKSGPWKFGGEFAHQFGEYDGGRDRTGYGGYIFGSRKFADMALKPEFELRFVSLSGDDPDTEKNENWDPLFSRAPYWNELLIYAQIYELIPDAYAIPGYWTNLQLYMAKASMELTPHTKLSLSYQYFRSNEKANPLSPYRAMFSNGHERGHLPTAMLSHKFSKNIDGFLQFEYFVPGNFYNDNAKNAIFFRWQLQFKV